MMSRDEEFMRVALMLAREAKETGRYRSAPWWYIMAR